MTVEAIREKLSLVLDPELNLDIITLGLVYGVRQEGSRAVIEMTLTTPMCPYGPQLIEDVKQSVKSLADVSDVEVNLVWDPPWGPDKLSEEAKLHLGIS